MSIRLKNSRLGYLFPLIILTAFLYLTAIWTPFEFDDRERIVDNPAIRNLSNIPAFFYSRELMPFGGEIYRPLGDISFAIDYAIWGINPLGFHLTNVLIHVINSALLFLFLELTFNSPWASMAASILFAWHPVQTEAVIWIKGREDLFVTMFTLLTLIWYRLYSMRSNRAYIFISLLSFVLALLSKEMAVVIPVILLMLDMIWKEDVRIKRYLPYAAIVAAYILARYLVLEQVAQRSYWGGGPVQTIYTMSRAISYYIKLLFFPVNLSLDYLGYPVSKAISDPYVIPSILFLLLISSFGVYRLLRHRDIAGLSVLWFFVTLAPVSNIIPLKIILAERFLYLPSIGLAFIYAKMAEGSSWRRSLPLILIITSFAVLTLEREYVWSSSSRLWEDAVKKMPYNDRAHFNLGSVYMEEGRFNDAVRENNAALKLNPFDPKTYVNRGLAYAALGESEKAMSDYRRALEIEPGLPNAHHNIGNLFLQSGDSSKAAEEFQKEMRGNSNKITMYRLYASYIATGNAAFERRDFPSAVIYYEKAKITIGEQEEAYLNLALTYLKMGNRYAAVGVYEELLKVRPDLGPLVRERMESMM